MARFCSVQTEGGCATVASPYDPCSSQISKLERIARAFE